MSSNILEQAIIDARALREAALKNAEASVLERYSSEVRGAIDVMLEADISDFGLPEEDELVSPEEEAEVAPLAAAEGEKLCSCPDEEEEVEWELSLDDLRSMSDDMGEPMGQEDLAMDFGAEGEEDELEGLLETVTGSFEESIDDDEEIELDESSEHDEEEDIELDEEMVKEIVEELIVDVKPTKSGWAGTPEPIVRRQEEEELARLAGTEAKEENDALVASVAELSEAKKVVETENEKLKQLIYDLNEKLNESILSSAKLLYTNQTLTSASLNERQKNRIVESIQDADSVEEAKVIYETLQSAAGPSIRKTPKSLNEVISRPSLHLSRRRNENKGHESVAKNRFQKLAGIKNK